MRSIGIALFYAFLSAAIWLADSAFLSFYNEIAFADALWSAVPAGRLALRLFIVGLILIFGYLKLSQFRREHGMSDCFSQLRHMENHMQGNAESREKSERVLFHCQNLADYFNMQDIEKDALRILCYCYDIGKISLPAQLLNKNLKLSPEEKKLYEKHTALGAEIIGSFENTRHAAPLIMYHHEYYNGGGVYGLKGEEIPLGCRIFAVAWAYDSMLNPQRRGRSYICREALEELRFYEGTAFDPEIVEAFIKMMNKTTILSSLGKRSYDFADSQ